MAVAKRKKRRSKPTKRRKSKASPKRKKRVGTRVNARRKRPSKRKGTKRTAVKRKRKRARRFSASDVRTIIAAIRKAERNQPSATRAGVLLGEENHLDAKQLRDMVENLELVCGGSKAKGVAFLQARFRLSKKAAMWYVAEYCTARKNTGVELASSAEAEEESEWIGLRPSPWKFI